jgi:hypothetical protein
MPRVPPAPWPADRGPSAVAQAAGGRSEERDVGEDGSNPVAGAHLPVFVPAASNAGGQRARAVMQPGRFQRRARAVMQPGRFEPPAAGVSVRFGVPAASNPDERRAAAERS